MQIKKEQLFFPTIDTTNFNLYLASGKKKGILRPVLRFEFQPRTLITFLTSE